MPRPTNMVTIVYPLLQDHEGRKQDHPLHWHQQQALGPAECCTRPCSSEAPALHDANAFFATVGAHLGELGGQAASRKSVGLGNRSKEVAIGSWRAPDQLSAWRRRSTCCPQRPVEKAHSPTNLRFKQRRKQKDWGNFLRPSPKSRPLL